MDNEQTHIYAEGVTELPEKTGPEQSDESLRQELQSRIVVIAFDGQYYGINIVSVLEILKVPSITRLPCSPDYIAGVISVRGNIQAVVKLKAFLKLGSGHIREQSRIALVESGELTAGLLIDEMLDILEIPKSAILPLTEQEKNLEGRYIEGTLRWHERTIVILHIDAILRDIAIEQQ